MTDHEQEGWREEYEIEKSRFLVFDKASGSRWLNDEKLQSFISEQKKRWETEAYNKGRLESFKNSCPPVGKIMVETVNGDVVKQIRLAEIRGGEAVLKEVNDAGCECDGEDCGYCKIRHFLVSVAKETVDRLREGLDGE